MTQFEVESIAEHEYLIRITAEADTAESQFSVDPRVLAELGLTGSDEAQVVRWTAAFLAERQSVSDFPQMVSLDDVVASYDDYPDELRSHLRPGELGHSSGPAPVGPHDTRQDGAPAATPRQRVVVPNADPAAYQALLGLQRYVDRSGLDRRLGELVKIRASQLNGCAFCLDMHNREARAAGEQQRRLDVLAAWREAPELFTEQERAVLALTEAVTRIGEAGVPDPVWGEVSRLFDERELVALLMAIATINVWNRLAIATHQPLPE
jgi:AhpD family alkylhydroperoxidase